MNERRSAKDRRRQRRLAERSLRTIVSRMADGVIIVDADGMIRFANPAAEQLFGRGSAELSGTYLGSPVVPADVAEIEVVRPDGQTISVDMRLVDVDWEGRAARLATLRDITDRKRAARNAAQLEQERIARAQAEAANKAKSEFLATMSHELRTPLNAVLGYADLLELGVAGPLTDQQRHHLRRIHAGGRHLLSLVNEVLDLSRVEAGRLTLHTAANRCDQTLDAALSLVQPAAETRGITVDVVANTDPSSVRPVLYAGDENRVRQVLVNLLGNAVKFTAPGGRIRVAYGVATEPGPLTRLSAETHEQWVFFRVEDTGVGIARDHLGTIFDPFVRVETGHTRSSDGSGLGLTIARRLARLMDGDLTAESDPGAGSRFTLWIPAVAGVTAGEQPVSLAPQRHLPGLADVAAMIEREMESLMDAFVVRLRAERLMPDIETTRYSELADHVPAFIAAMTSSLGALSESHGAPSSILDDGRDLQRLVAERHGAHRARMGWSESALHVEWQLLRAEIERVIARGNPGVSSSAPAEVTSVLATFLHDGEDASRRAFLRGVRTSAQRSAAIDAPLQVLSEPASGDPPPEPLPA